MIIFNFLTINIIEIDDFTFQMAAGDLGVVSLAAALLVAEDSKSGD